MGRKCQPNFESKEWFFLHHGQLFGAFLQCRFFGTQFDPHSGLVLLEQIKFVDGGCWLVDRQAF